MQHAGTKQQLLNTVNIAPVHSKEARKLYAIIARGEENTQDIAFYGDLTECIPTANKQTDDKHTDDKQTDDKKTDDKQTDGKQTDEDFPIDRASDESQGQEETWLQHINTYKESLYIIADDLTSRLMEGDHNLKSGVGKFIQQYNRMTKSHAPNSTLSYALHNFGKSDSKLQT